MSRKALLILLMLTIVMVFSACGPEPAEETGTVPPFNETPLNSSNVAREGFAVASSSKYDEGFSNLYLNDGDLSRGFTTRWGEVYDRSAPQYVLLDLAGTYTVEAVKLYPLKGEEKGFPVCLVYFPLSDEDWQKNISDRNRRVAQGTYDAYPVDEGLREKCQTLFEAPGEDEIDLLVPHKPGSGNPL